MAATRCAARRRRGDAAASFDVPASRSDPTRPDAPLAWSEVSFDDLAPTGVDMRQCWNAMGMDDRGRLYIGFTSVRSDGREDVPVFRYDPSNGERAFLGTLLDVAAAAGNLLPGESIPKGHTRMIFVDGRLFLGSQGFHDFKEGIDALPSYRGSHLFALDTATGAWRDLAASLPGGVVTEHDGIVALTVMRGEHLLVGLAHPSSNLVLYDYRAGRLRGVVPGIPWRRGIRPSREMPGRGVQTLLAPAASKG